MSRLLLIDNSLNESAQFMQTLAEDGYLIEHVASLFEGAARSKKRPFDALLLELNLADSQGLATLIAAREEFPSMPIVVLTNQEDDQTVAAAYLHGAQDYLLKSNVTSIWLSQAVKHAIFRGHLLRKEAIPPTEQDEENASHQHSIWSQETIDEVVVLRLLPKRLLDAAIILTIEERLTSLVDGGNPHLIVSMENVEYISNAALGVLIGTQKKIRSRNGGLLLADLRKNVRNQLGSRQFHRLFKIFEDVGSALASIAAP